MNLGLCSSMDSSSGSPYLQLSSLIHLCRHPAEVVVVPLSKHCMTSATLENKRVQDLEQFMIEGHRAQGP